MSLEAFLGVARENNMAWWAASVAKVLCCKRQITSCGQAYTVMLLATCHDKVEGVRTQQTQLACC